MDGVALRADAEVRGARAGPAVQHSKNGDQLRSHACLIKQPEGKCNRRHGRVETRAHNVPFYDAFGRSAGRTDAGATWKSADSVSARPHLRLDENERLERLVRAGDAPARRGPTISLVSEPISSNSLKNKVYRITWNSISWKPNTCVQLWGVPRSDR